METNTPRMRRPKRKLCYLSSYENPQPWTGALSLMDVDKMFDDIDSSPQDELCPPSPLLSTFVVEKLPDEKVVSPIPPEETGPEKVKPHSSKRSPGPTLDDHLDIPFVAHLPAKTSSPIEENIFVKAAEKFNDKLNSPPVTPALFPLEEEVQDTANAEPQKHQSNEQVKEEIDIANSETPPSKIVKIVIAKDTQSIRKKTSQPDKPVVAQRKQPESATSVDGSKKDPKPKESSKRVVKDMTGFLQKLKEAVQSKPPQCSRMSALPVEVPAPTSPPPRPTSLPPPPPPPSSPPLPPPTSPPPTSSSPPPPPLSSPPSPPPPPHSPLTPPPPEPEDEFLILEDDEMTFQFYIPRKSGLSRKPKQSRSSSSNKDSSSEKGSKDSLVKTPQKQEESEKASDKLGRDNLDLGTKRKGNKKMSESCKASFVSPVDPPTNDLKTQENVKPPKKAQSKKSAKNHQTDTETDTEKPPEKPKTKATKSSETKKSKHIQSKEEHRKAKKSSTGTRKRPKVSDAGEKKSSCPSSEEQNDTEALAPPTETQRVDSDPEEKIKRSKPISEQSSSDDEHVFGKRRRRQTGQWWMISSQSTEETDNQVDLVKKSKASIKNSNTAVPLSAAKNKKDKVLKKRKQKETDLSSPNLNQAKGKKTKQKINRNTKQNIQDKKTKSQEVLKSDEVEQMEQEVIDGGMDHEHSRSSSSTRRKHNNNSEEHVIQTQSVGHNSVNERVQPISPMHLKEQLYRAEPSKRRRKPTGNWWMVNDDNNVAVGSLSPLMLPQKERKPSKDREKPSKQRTSPKSNNQDTLNLSSKPAEGAPVAVKPVLTPKTVKRSLAKFKDIFTSGVDTPSVMKSRDVQQHHRRDIATHPAVEDCETDTEMLTECRRESTSYVFRSGACSLIQLEEHEENGETVLPTSRGQAALSVSDLCGPPLQPLSLQPKDKVNLREMFKCLWSTLAKNNAEITPDHFDWFFHKDRAMGILEDLNDSTYCSGKLLLGSYMKKPLWVDHSATTVFHLNSSTVNVSVNATKFSYSPGQAFVVHCGCAYSIKNITAQPALLYFTRMIAESSE